MTHLARFLSWFVWPLAIAVGSLPASAAFEQVLNGRVVEHDGGKPLAGAFVFATWIHQGADPVGSRTSCVRLEVVRTDEAGRFSFSLPIFGAEPEVEVFAPKYEQYLPSNSMTEAEIRASNRLVEVVPLSAPERRRRLYTRVSSLRTCNSDNLIDTLMPLYEAVDKEAAELGLKADLVRALTYLKRTEDAANRREERKQ